MPAYMLFIRDEPIRDQAEMAEYQRKSRENKHDFPIKPLVLYGAMEGVEGAAPDGVVMLEFPSVADARAWYDSPGYQTAAQHRLKAADYRVFIVEGLQA